MTHLQPKVLVANRGEIAVRIFRACRELGLPSVAVYTDVDQNALHLRYADEVVPLGDRQNYLSIPAVMAAARAAHAAAVHPGYGFLAENAAFAQAVEDAGMIFIGPRPQTIALMGDKLASRQAAQAAGLPILPGSDRPLPPQVPLHMAAQVAYPVLVKAAAGGGGRGIRLVRSPEELEPMIAAARQEALSAFGDDTVYLESMVQQARHIEVQILGEGSGCVTVLGERECSIQRRRQKLIEEAPAPGLTPVMLEQIHTAAMRLGCHLQYRGLGTVEFLLDPHGHFHFIEVNPRIQVEHPVTEMVTGVDLVQAQLLLALNLGRPPALDAFEQRGCAIEARILAEDPALDFLPAVGEITYLKEPGGPGVRVDSALFQGMQVTADYDSLLAKVIAWGPDRPSAIRRLRRALGELQIGGLPTSAGWILQILDSPAFQEGRVTTTYLDSFQPAPAEPEPTLERELALAAALVAHRARAPLAAGASTAAVGPSRWQLAAWQEQMSRI
ncbi:acetyl-CoA carboxylase biotin carboxylase subunit [Levilinea saccharolytica]|uniref:acetyl-CoA carboxylase biotin carboxylase subunit n=1 Tax=Levilinea saccharolytica TaxID=229921 RepID=UPI0009465535|nr:biotin carboxylase N-terminal domain-containing protein [Levilinea saccharolytica]GAP18298.1 acetyl/propionyl-CoA carboxylase, alpha subunit [Levilinea saccharolytica]